MPCACDTQVRQAVLVQPLPLLPQMSIVGSCACHDTPCSTSQFQCPSCGHTTRTMTNYKAQTAEGMPCRPAAGEKRKGEAVGGPNKHPVMKQSKLNMWAKPHTTSPQDSSPDPKPVQAAGRGRQREKSVISID